MQASSHKSRLSLGNIILPQGWSPLKWTTCHTCESRKLAPLDKTSTLGISRMVLEESTNIQWGRLHMWTHPLLSSPHWMGNLYLGSLLSHSIKGIFYVHHPHSIHPVSNLSLLNTTSSSGSWHILNHWSRLTFHVVVSLSGPHHPLQWVTLTFPRTILHCEMN